MKASVILTLIIIAILTIQCGQQAQLEMGQNKTGFIPLYNYNTDVFRKGLPQEQKLFVGKTIVAKYDSINKSYTMRDVRYSYDLLGTCMYLEFSCDITGNVSKDVYLIIRYFGFNPPYIENVYLSVNRENFNLKLKGKINRESDGFVWEYKSKLTLETSKIIKDIVRSIGTSIRFLDKDLQDKYKSYELLNADIESLKNVLYAYQLFGGEL